MIDEVKYRTRFQEEKAEGDEAGLDTATRSF